MNKNSSIKKNFIMNCILTISSFLVPLIVFPHVSRVLLPSGIGKVSLAMSIVSYFSLFVMLGIPTYGVKIVAQCRDNKEKLSRNVIEILLVNLIMLCIVGIIYLLFVFIFNNTNEQRLLYIILGITLLTEPIGVEWLYKGLEKYTYITVRSLVFKLFSLIGIFIFVKAENDYLPYAFFSIFGSIGSNLCNFIAIHKHIDKVQIDIKDSFKQIKPIMLFAAITVATTIYTNLDNVMLGVITNEAEVGYYSAVVKVRSLLVSIVTSLGVVLLPRTSYYVERQMYKQFYNLSIRAMNFVCVMAFPLTVFFILNADSSIYILSGKEFLPASMPLQLILPTIIFVGITNLTGIQMLIPLGKENIVLKSVICGAITDFCFNIFLIPRFRASGAAVSTLIAEIVVMIVQIRYFDKKVIKKLFSQRWKLLFGAVFIAAIFSTLFMIIIKNIYIGFLVSGMVYFIIYFLILLLGKERITVEIIKFLWDLAKNLF